MEEKADIPVDNEPIVKEVEMNHVSVKQMTPDEKLAVLMEKEKIDVVMEEVLYTLSPDEASKLISQTSVSVTNSEFNDKPGILYSNLGEALMVLTGMFAAKRLIPEKAEEMRSFIDRRMKQI